MFVEWVKECVWWDWPVSGWVISLILELWEQSHRGHRWGLCSEWTPVARAIVPMLGNWGDWKEASPMECVFKWLGVFLKFLISAPFENHCWSIPDCNKHCLLNIYYVSLKRSPVTHIHSILLTTLQGWYNVTSFYRWEHREVEQLAWCCTDNKRQSQDLHLSSSSSDMCC